MSELAIRYRRADLADVPRMAHLPRPGEAGGASEERMARYLEGTHHPQQALAPRAMWIALHGDTPIGYIAGHLTRRYDCDGELQWIHVVAEHRGTGIAVELLRLLAAWFKELHAHRICVDVGDDRARPFYGRHGATELNRHWMVWPDIRVALDGSPEPEPFGAKQFVAVGDRRIALIEAGEGDAIVFQHGNPTSSYLWRNVMPHCNGLGRLIACDLIGMGDSEKLDDSGPNRYSYAEQRDYLFALWDRLDLGDRVVFVLHDWGSALGFEWANAHHDRVQGLVYMESIVMPLTWDDWPEAARRVFRGLRSEAGESMVLEKNVFVERVLPGSILRKLSDEEMSEFRRPFATPGEDRRPTLSWPRQIPIDGQPPDVTRIVESYSAWLAQSKTPKLFVNADPGSILVGRQRELCRTWKNQSEITVRGSHFIQEDSPHEIGAAIADFVRRIR